MTIRTLGVIGAGTMGNGIAQAAAQAGLDVVMQDIMPEAVERGLAAIGTSLDRLIRKEKLDEAGKAAALARIRSTTDVAALKGADLVIEAATERESVKAQVLRNVEAVVRPDAILATNTSSISITRLAASLKDPSRFVGMHFFNPVPMMALVEIISGLQTSQTTFDAVTGLAKTLGKGDILRGFDSEEHIPWGMLSPTGLQGGLCQDEDSRKSCFSLTFHGIRKVFFFENIHKMSNG